MCRRGRGNKEVALTFNFMEESLEALQVTEKTRVVYMLYCGICSGPLEYCGYASKKVECLAWARDNSPDDEYSKLYGPVQGISPPIKQ
jgi:hypothetical protein